jgi:hypothetical protein
LGRRPLQSRSASFDRFENDESFGRRAMSRWLRWELWEWEACPRHRFARMVADFAHQRGRRTGRACSSSAQVRAGDRGVKSTLNNIQLPRGCEIS